MFKEILSLIQGCEELYGECCSVCHLDDHWALGDRMNHVRGGWYICNLTAFHPFDSSFYVWTVLTDDDHFQFHFTGAVLIHYYHILVLLMVILIWWICLHPPNNVYTIYAHTYPWFSYMVWITLVTKINIHQFTLHTNLPNFMLPRIQYYYVLCVMYRCCGCAVVRLFIAVNVMWRWMKFCASNGFR